MRSQGRVLILGLILGILAGCHNQPRQAAAPPGTTQAACVQVRDLFGRRDIPTSAPADMSMGCHFYVTAPQNFGVFLNKQLESNGWKIDPSYNKEAHHYGWIAPATHCVIEQYAVVPNGPPVHGSVGMSGGSHLGPNFGLGLNIGSFGSSPLDYKVDCLPFSTDRK